ncbi:MAG: stage V sporulation protein AA [Lachnospiraceae bacterium]|nr:stage V sporulation protein AA [Lachnospiraceae bacterium]
MANAILYVKAEKNVELTKDAVLLGDIAKLFCRNEHITNKAKTLKVYQFPKQGEKRQVISVLKIIELLYKEFPDITVENIGEIDTIVGRVAIKGIDRSPNILKIAFISLITFFGTSFTIMAFHNDIGMDKLFNLIYSQVMGYETDQYTILEFFYSLGLALGIIIFFNHIGGRRITKDPTPIEVEMRMYEDEVNTTLVEVWNREEKSVEVR